MLSLKAGLAGRGALSLVRRENWSSLLQDISFDVAPGQMVALVGEVGKVKACCCNVCSISYQTICVSTALLPWKVKRWAVMIFANVVAIPSATSHKVFQALNPLLSIEKHLRRACQLSDQQWNAGKIERLLQRSRLESRVLDAFPRQLSGGMAKRVLACHASLESGSLYSGG